MSVVCCAPAHNVFNQNRIYDNRYKSEVNNMRCNGRVNSVPAMENSEELLFEMLIRDGYYSKPPPSRPQARNYKKTETKTSARYLSSNGYSGGQVSIPEVPVAKPEASWPNVLRKKKEVKRPIPQQAVPPTWPLKERPLSIDPSKDYSQALTVDCSVEYDLPKNIRPPEGAAPILKIASPVRPKPSLPTATWILQPVNNHYLVQSDDQIFLVPAEVQLVGVQDEQYIDTIILPSGVQTPVVSNDSGRGTDGCRSPMEILTPDGNHWIYQTNEVPITPEPVPDHYFGHIDTNGTGDRRHDLAGPMPFLPSYASFGSRQPLLVPTQKAIHPQGVHHRKSYSMDGHQRNQKRAPHARIGSALDLFEIERNSTHINPVLWTLGPNSIIYV